MKRHTIPALLGAAITLAAFVPQAGAAHRERLVATLDVAPSSSEIACEARASSVRLSCPAGSIIVDTLVVRMGDKKRKIAVTARLNAGQSKTIDLGDATDVTGFRISHRGKGTLQVHVAGEFSDDRRHDSGDHDHGPHGRDDGHRSRHRVAGESAIVERGTAHGPGDRGSWSFIGESERRSAPVDIHLQRPVRECRILCTSGTPRVYRVVAHDNGYPATIRVDRRLRRDEHLEFAFAEGMDVRYIRVEHNGVGRFEVLGR